MKMKNGLLKYPLHLFFSLFLLGGSSILFSAMSPIIPGHEKVVNISSDVLTKLYKGSTFVDIPLEKLYDANGDRINLKDLFESNGIYAGEPWENGVWTDQEWNNTLSRFC